MADDVEFREHNCGASTTCHNPLMKCPERITHLLARSTDKNRLALQNIDEDGYKLLEKGRIDHAGRIVLQAVSKLVRSLNLEFDI